MAAKLSARENARNGLRLLRIRKLLGIATLLCRGDLRVIRSLRYGCAPSVEHFKVLRRLGGINTVVDLGANRGQFALAATRIFPKAKVFAFEPLSDPARVFRSVFAQTAQVELHRFAIGPGNEAGMMHVSARDDSSSLLPISVEQVRVFPGTESVGTENVEVRTLDACLEHDQIRPPALLKIDVQGYEHKALEGCESLLHRFSFILCECSFVELYEGQKLAPDIIAWLDVRGFRVVKQCNLMKSDGGTRIQADFLFARDAPGAANGSRRE